VQLKNTGIKVFELVAPGSSTPLNDQFINVDGFNPKMMMDPGKLIDAAIKGLEKENLEIYPGLAKMLKVMSRLAPAFLLTQASKVGVKIMENGKQKQKPPY
jgi:uncharacterized oxidoreductase